MRTLDLIRPMIVKGWCCLPRWDRWFAIPFMFILFALAGWIPGLYVRTTEIPPFEQLQRTSGTLFFESGGRGGWVTKLKTQQGIVAFSCWTGGRGSGCVSAPPSHSLKEWQNRPATVWWFLRPNPFSRNKFAAQVEIDGIIIMSYSDSIRKLSIAKSGIVDFMAFYIIFPFVYIGLRIRLCFKKEVTPHE